MESESRKRMIFRLLVFCIILSPLALVLLSCNPAKKEAPSGKIVKIRVSGSGTCLPLIKILAKAYLKENPSVEFEFLPGVHSAGGIKGVAEETLDLGAVSRELKPEEKKSNLEYYLFSNDGLAIGTSSENHITGLTSDQIKSIYSGIVTNWKEVDGPDKEIVVLDRNEDESAKIIMRKYVLGPDLKITSDAVLLYYESDMIEALKTNTAAIGYFSLGYALSERLKFNLLELDGVAPTVKNIESGKYKMIRPLGVVVSAKKKTVTKPFIDFCLSNVGRKLMLKAGFAPAF